MHRRQHPLSPHRKLERVLGLLERLPLPALALLTERLLDRMDAADGDLDMEPDHEGLCEAEEALIYSNDCRAGDPDDLEDDDPQGDIHHDADHEPSCDDEGPQPCVGWWL